MCKFDKEGNLPLNFGGHPHMDPDIGFFKDSATLQDRAFMTLHSHSADGAAECNASTILRVKRLLHVK